MQPLTHRQQEVLIYLQEYLSQQGFPPTLREISAHLGITGTVGAMHHLEALEKKGFIRRHAGGSRGITLLHQPPADPEEQGTYPDAPSGAAFLPVVGVVRAGLPQPPLEDIEDFHPVSDAAVRTGAAYFLRVQGDSMINAGVLNGDLALIKPQPTAENRDMVVALVDGEATIKWFHHEGNRIRLQPANPNFEPIYVSPDRDVAIIGKVVGLYRSLV